jgi:hypothetical protein
MIIYDTIIVQRFIYYPLLSLNDWTGDILKCHFITLVRKVCHYDSPMNYFSILHKLYQILKKL